MTSSPAPELPEDEKDARFLALFGKTRDQVRAVGIDPDDYAIQHIREAMNNDKIAAQMLAPSAYARRLELRWLWRGWVAIFLGFAFLLLSLVKHLHVIAVVLVCIDLLVVVAFSVVGWRYWIRYLRAARQENIRSWGGTWVNNGGPSAPRGEALARSSATRLNVRHHGCGVLAPGDPYGVTTPRPCRHASSAMTVLGAIYLCPAGQCPDPQQLRYVGSRLRPKVTGGGLPGRVHDLTRT